MISYYYNIMIPSSFCRTKIMIKYPQIVFDIENRFQGAKHTLAAKIQSMWRGYVTRKQYEKLKTATVFCQRMYRLRLRRRQLRKLREYEIVTQRIIFVQKNVRRLLATRAYRKTLNAAVTIRKY